MDVELMTLCRSKESECPGPTRQGSTPLGFIRQWGKVTGPQRTPGIALAEWRGTMMAQSILKMPPEKIKYTWTSFHVGLLVSSQWVAHGETFSI